MNNGGSVYFFIKFACLSDSSKVFIFSDEETCETFYFSGSCYNEAWSFARINFLFEKKTV